MKETKRKRIALLSEEERKEKYGSHNRGRTPPNKGMSQHDDLRAKIASGNTRIRYEYKGKLLTSYELSERSGIPRRVIRQRINQRKWPIEKALMTPVGATNGSNQYRAKEA